MSNQFCKKLDVESGTWPLLESPELNRSFIQKVYSIVVIQLLGTIANGVVIFTIYHTSTIFPQTTTGIALYIVYFFVYFILLCHVDYYGQKYPVNHLMLLIFTHSTSVVFGLVSCAFASEVTLEAVILTVVVVVALTLFTFWAARRGQDFSFLELFLFGSDMVLLIFGLIQWVQVFFQDGEFSMMIYGCVGTIISCGYIVCDTDNLIKRFSHDEYINGASVTLYLDVIELFFPLLFLLHLIQINVIFDATYFFSVGTNGF